MDATINQFAAKKASNGWVLQVVHSTPRAPTPDGKVQANAMTTDTLVFETLKGLRDKLAQLLAD